MTTRPRCQCHNVEMVIRNERPRNPWRCAVAHREAQGRYQYTDKGYATRDRYESSIKGIMHSVARPRHPLGTVSPFAPTAPTGADRANVSRAIAATVAFVSPSAQPVRRQAEVTT